MTLTKDQIADKFIDTVLNSPIKGIATRFDIWDKKDNPYYIELSNEIILRKDREEIKKAILNQLRA